MKTLLNVKYEKGLVKSRFCPTFPFMTINFVQKMVILRFLDEIDIAQGEENHVSLTFYGKNDSILGAFDAKIDTFDGILIDFLSELELKNTGNCKVQNEKYPSIVAAK